MVAEIKLPQKAVVDASLILSLLLPDEKTKERAEKTLGFYQEGKISFFAPELLKFEVVNGLRMAIKRKRINQKLAKKLLKVFLELKIDYQGINLAKVLGLALKFNLSAYDASYVTLARRLKFKLLTLDSRLTKLA